MGCSEYLIVKGKGSSFLERGASLLLLVDPQGPCLRETVLDSFDSTDLETEENLTDSHPTVQEAVRHW